jgi:phosphoribosyl-ATP pyrophosphohydrolase/phosphoribosyl-AMP cyclohydrolase
MILFDTLKLNTEGLIPCIIVDSVTKTVLMLAYMNREAFEITQSTGRMTYYSRSRSCLWEKGLTSGNTQKMLTLKADCDKDTLLFEIEQKGPACHTGSPSCFTNTLYENPLSVLTTLEATIKARRLTPLEGSYTTYLFEKGLDKILKKIGEESTEVVIAAKNPSSEDLLNETADLLYHLMVLLNEKEQSLQSVLNILESRQKQ